MKSKVCKTYQIENICFEGVFAFISKDIIAKIDKNKNIVSLTLENSLEI